MNTIIDKCKEMAKIYPYNTADIFGWFNLITDCRKANGLEMMKEDEQFDQLKKVLEYCGDAQYNPSAMIDIIYSPSWKR